MKSSNGHHEFLKLYGNYLKTGVTVQAREIKTVTHHIIITSPSLYSYKTEVCKKKEQVVIDEWDCFYFENICVLCFLMPLPHPLSPSFYLPFFPPSRSVAFSHYLSKINRGFILPFDDSRASSSSPNQVLILLFTVSNSSSLRSRSPTLTYQLLSTLCRMTKIRTPSLIPHPTHIIT